MNVDQYFSNEWKSNSAVEAESEKTSACFDCNICLEFAHDPVVTLCGHLYCWPCLFKWFRVQRSSLASNERSVCPVCKSVISLSTVVPLYARGQSLSKPEFTSNSHHPEILIPPRPRTSGNHMASALNSCHQFSLDCPNQIRPRLPHFIYRNEAHTSPQTPNVGESTAMRACHPVLGMFGEMGYAISYRNSENLYTYPNSYHSAGSSSSRFRRMEMMAEKSLHRISVFLLCCLLLCLLLF